MGEEVPGGGRGRRGAELRALRLLAAGDPPRRQVLQHPPHRRLRAPGSTAPLNSGMQFVCLFFVLTDMNSEL